MVDDPPLIARTCPGRADLPSIVLLHGSGQDETTLLPFAQAACPSRTLITVRGRIPWESGYAFFRRRADRSLDEADLARAAAALRRLLADLRDGGHQPPVLLGYSNGAIAAAAAILHDRWLSAGAILLRPLTPLSGRALPRLDGYPVLLVSGRQDPRRHPSDAATLARQLTSAGAVPTLLELPIQHELSDADRDVVESWLPARATGSSHPEGHRPI